MVGWIDGIRQKNDWLFFFFYIFLAYTNLPSTQNAYFSLKEGNWTFKEWEINILKSRTHDKLNACSEFETSEWTRKKFMRNENNLQGKNAYTSFFFHVRRVVLVSKILLSFTHI